MRRACVVAVVCMGCGSGPGGGGPDAPITGDDATGDTWVELVGRDWQIAPGTFDNYRCRKIAVTQEMWIAGFRSLSPTGTHHEIVTISNDATNLGDYDCTAGNLDPKMLFAGGIQTDDLLFPAGVAMHVVPGQYLNLNLHVFDSTDQALSGHSGVLVKTLDAAAVVHEADMAFAGTYGIGTGFVPAGIPPDSQPHTAIGGCTVPEDWHVFALWPHMHQIGTHQSVQVAGSMVLDTPYSFLEQKNFPMTDMVFHQNDQLVVTCTYVNTTTHTVTQGDGSDHEMCFTGMYRWIETRGPNDGAFFCVSTQ